MSKKFREIKNAKITHVSLVNKGANGQDFLIIKSEDEPTISKDIPIIKVDDDKQLVTGIVYEPETVDSQGEFMTAEEIEKAAHTFMKDYHNIDKQHTFKNEDADVVESYVAKSDHKIGDQEIKKGTWVMTTHIGDEEIWKDIKKGKIKGYSMGGSGQRVEHDNASQKVNKEDNESLESSGNEEYKGFFDVMKSFFTGITKADTKTASFTDRMAVNDITEGMWRVNDTLRSTMRDILNSEAIKDKHVALNQAIDEYAEYMKKKIKGVKSNVTKSDQDFFFSEPVEKAGRKISSKRLSSLKDAVSSLTAIINEVEGNNEEETKVNKEEMQEIMKSAMEEAFKPINDRLDKLEKEDGKEVTKSEDANGEIVEVVKSAVADSLNSIEERLSKVEKARGISKQIDDDQGDQEEVQKSTSVWTGILG